MPNPSIKCTPEHIEHIRECLRGDECERCHGEGTITFKGDNYPTSCFNCKGTGRIPRSVRVTVAFEEQPEETSKFNGFFDLPLGGKCAMFLGPTESNTFALPLPLNTEVEVREENCPLCLGRGGYPVKKSGRESIQYCAHCDGTGSPDTGLRLHTSREPFCEYWGLCQDGFLGEGSPEYYEILLNDAGEGKYVACYECGIEEVKG